MTFSERWPRHLSVLILSMVVVPRLSFSQSTMPKDVSALELQDGHLRLHEKLLSASWSLAEGGLKPITLTDVSAHQTYDLSSVSVFRIAVTENGKHRTIDSSKLKVTVPLTVAQIEAKPYATRLTERVSGWRATATLADAKTNARFEWQLIAREGQNYFREQLTIRAGKSDLSLARVTLIDLPLRFPWVDGTVPGSPIISGNLFCGVEHPSAINEIDAGMQNNVGNAKGSLERTVPITAGQSLTVSEVVGASAAGQMRRDFQTYVNQERARPYAPFLHYNSWYDLGYFSPFDEKDALGAIDTIGEELSHKRGVKISSFMFDDGWDNHKSLWDFNSGFPNGFTPLTQAAKQSDAGLGVWMSPWGGYGPPKEERIKSGKPAGYETNDGGFALSGPKYYERFRSVCLDMVNRFGINQFKFDGTGNVTSQYPGSKFGTDFDAMISLLQDLRAAKPDLYVNLTTGTWPSPFWTQFADSIWRGGEDHSFAGVGTYRQRWITYRDGDEYHGVVQLGPLFPINSLMLHGIIYAKHAMHLGEDPGNDFADEVHDYFGTGTQCQEMYITGALLSQQNWDTLAEAAKWSRANAQTLEDVHWVGGDPTKGELYGYAAWSRDKGILTLRNPTDRPMSIELDPAKLFELPGEATGSFSAHSPWAGEAGQPATSLQCGVAHRFDLKPWQVMTLEAIPGK